MGFAKSVIATRKHAEAQIPPAPRSNTIFEMIAHGNIHDLFKKRASLQNHLNAARNNATTTILGCSTNVVVSSKESTDRIDVFERVATISSVARLFNQSSAGGNDLVKEEIILKIPNCKESSTSPTEDVKSASYTNIKSLNRSSSSKTSSLEPATGSSCTLRQKYGKSCKYLGRGTNSSCFTVKSASTGQTYAVKAFKNSQNLPQREWRKSLTTEYCIGSLLHHPNVIETLDLIFEKDRVYEVMEFCQGRDLNDIICHTQIMDEPMIDCIFAQLLHGVVYLHSNGVAHRDLKLENCLLDEQNHLRIIDFGCAAVFKTPFESLPRMCSGRCGTKPYMAPEEFSHELYDGRQVDVWSCGIVYMVLTLKKFPWLRAQPSDPCYKKYLSALENGQVNEQFAKLKHAKSLIMKMLNPNPIHRISSECLLDDVWIKSISST